MLPDRQSVNGSNIINNYIYFIYMAQNLLLSNAIKLSSAKEAAAGNILRLNSFVKRDFRNY
jgi:hypothetical protein